MAQETTFGAAQIRKLYRQNFGLVVQQLNINELSDDQIEKAVNNTMGGSLPDFLPFTAFKTLIVPYINKVQPVAKNCLESVFQYIQSLAKDLCKDIFCNYPSLLVKVSQITATELMKTKERASSKLSDVIKVKCCIYTENKHYTENSQIKHSNDQISLSGLYSPSTSPVPPPPMDINLMRTKLVAYYECVFKPDIKDLIPQTIETFLLKEISDALDVAFLEIIRDRDNYGNLLEEPSDRQSERAKLMDEQSILMKAHGILSEFSWR